MTGRGPHVSALRTTPVKGFAVQDSPVLVLTEDGVEGDRAFFMVDDEDRLVSATATAAFLPYSARFETGSDRLTIGRGEDVVLSDRVTTGEPVRAHFFGDRHATGQVVDGPWGALLSGIAGRRVRLVRADDPLGGYDVHRVSLASEASVRVLDDGSGPEPLDSRRLRMTVTVDGTAPFAEDGWVGRLVRIGDAVVRLEVPVRRCAAVQRHPAGLDVRGDVLRRIKEVRGTTTTAAGRGLHLGVYGEVVAAGLVRVGDPVRVEEGPSG